jgi:hypothetical protein
LMTMAAWRVVLPQTSDFKPTHTAADV